MGRLMTYFPIGKKKDQHSDITILQYRQVWGWKGKTGLVRQFTIRFARWLIDSTDDETKWEKSREKKQIEAIRHFWGL